MIDDDDVDPVFIAAAEFGKIGYLRRHRDEIERQGIDLSPLAKAFAAWDRVEAELYALHRELDGMVIPGLLPVDVSGDQDRTAANAAAHVCRFDVDLQKADDLSIDLLELLHKRAGGPGEAFFVVTRLQLLLMRAAAQRARGGNETEIDYDLPPDFVSHVMDQLLGLLGRELMRLSDQGVAKEDRMQ